MSVIILQDEIVHYEVLGRGRPLIFLHGWVGSWRYWIPTMQAASTSFRTYAVDLWGFGDSAKNPHFYSLDQQVTLLDQFLDRMGIGKVAVIGHGLGAVVALLFSQQYPGLVDRFMAICLPNGTNSIHPRLFSDPLPELADWLLSRTPASEAARQEAPKADPRAIHLSLDGIQSLNLAQLRFSLSTPCLMVYGLNDPVVSVPVLPAEASEPESSHLIVLDQSGHFPMLDEQSKFNRLMVDFLALVSGISPRQLQVKEEWRRRVR